MPFHRSLSKAFKEKIAGIGEILSDKVFSILQSKEIEKARETLAQDLPVFRAQMGITQEELSQIIGITRQTYSLIETLKKPMSQDVFLSLILLFNYNDRTKEMLDRNGAFTDGLKAVCNYNGRQK